MNDPGNTPPSIAPFAWAGSAVFGGGGVAGVWFAAREGWGVLVIFLAGLLFVGLLLLLYRWILALWRRRKQQPLLRSILSNTAVTLQGISEPARRAKLDDLRRSFESGIGKFKAAGKDVYALPWYMMVGEPAAGKTEAIRRSSVGFPPGLQDYAQGAGGTINMNWWFTNHAIILDTAGRLIFEEVAPGGSSEWKEFLRLLTVNRPNCPINGLLLVIPADSVIKDRAEEIERKAGKIAQQLDTIQRSLGVRFPVFVIISKCDLINGFREFFDNVENPQLQGQMLGWSNPAPLDARFDPEQVRQHLESVSRRLMRRRYQLLLDPIHTDDPSQRRIDQVDALFTFPDSFMNIAPRLQRYMEMIFTVGEWSPKPLFLRGIYFTSSMREGSALDAELADILNVPVESLNEGRVWERERAYFLKDLFVKKVFPEKGLVTRASNSKKLQRVRKMTIMGSAVIAILVVGVMTWFGSVTYRASLGGHVQFWSTIADGYQNWPIIEDGPKYPPSAHYGGTRQIDTGDAPTLGDLIVNVPSRVSLPIDVPIVFKPVAPLLDRSELDKLRKQAYGVVYERCAIDPAVEAARYKLANYAKPENWTDAASAALVDLVRLETEAAGGDDSAGGNRISIDHLLEYTLTDEGFKSFRADRHRAARDPDNWLYTPGQGDRAWQPQQFVNGAPHITLIQAVAVFHAYWTNRIKSSGDRSFDAITRLQEAMKSFSTHEAQLAAVIHRPVNTKAEFDDKRAQWSAPVRGFDEDTAAVTAAFDDLAHSVGGFKPGTRLVDLYRAGVAQTNTEARDAYRVLADAAKPLHSWLRVPEAPQRVPSAEELAELATLDAFLEPMNGVGNKPQRRYEVYDAIYQDAFNQLSQADKGEPVSVLGTANVADVLKGADSSAASPAVTAQLHDAGADPHALMAVEAWTQGTRLAARCRHYSILNSLLPQQTPSADSIGTMIQKATGSVYPVIRCEATIPLTNVKAGQPLDMRFNPAAAHALVEAWGSATTASAAADSVLEQPELNRRATNARTALAAYLEQYLVYWSQTVPGMVAVGDSGRDTWSSYFKDDPADATAINQALASLFTMCANALQTVGLPGTPIAERAASTQAQFQRCNQTIQSDAFKKATQQILSTWKLNTDVSAARDALLKETPDTYKQKYLLSDGAEWPVGAYWNGYSRRRLTLLAAAWQETGREEFDRKIRPLIAFPLNNSQDRVLGTDEFARAVAAIRAFAGASLASGGRTIGEGARVEGISGSVQIESLRRLYNPPEDAHWFTKVIQISDAFSNASAKVKLSLMNQDDRQKLLQKNTSPPDGVLSDLLVKQGDTIVAQTRLLDTPTSDIGFGSFSMAGMNAVSFQVSKFANAAPEQKLLLPAPWAGPSLLFNAHNAQPVAGNAHRWQVELALGNNISLWLYVDFEKELPSKSDWPSLGKTR